MKVGVAFKTMKMIFFALLAGQIAATVFTQSFEVDTNINFEAIPKLYFIITILAIVTGAFLFKNALKPALANDSLKAKINIYQTAMLIRAAILEGAVFFLLFGFPENNNIHLVFIAILLAYFATLYPSKTRVSRELQLDFQAQQLLENDEEYLV
jgi:hypothetical protein